MPMLSTLLQTPKSSMETVIQVVNYLRNGMGNIKYLV